MSRYGEIIWPKEPPKEPKWLIYQKAVADLEARYEDCTVHHDHTVRGRRSGTDRQVDVWLEVQVGANHVVTIAVECKNLAEPVQIKDVDAFYGFLDDVGANKGVMFSSSGFTKGALARAEPDVIELRTYEEAEDFDWAEYVDDACQVFATDCLGSVSWTMEDGDSAAGHCWSCGTFHLRCGECGAIDYEPTPESGSPWGSDSEAIYSCTDEGCPLKFRIWYEKGEPTGIEEIRPEEPTEDEC